MERVFKACIFHIVAFNAYLSGRTVLPVRRELREKIRWGFFKVGKKEGWGWYWRSAASWDLCPWKRKEDYWFSKGILVKKDIYDFMAAHISWSGERATFFISVPPFFHGLWELSNQCRQLLNLIKSNKLAPFSLPSLLDPGGKRKYIKRSPILSKS